MITTKAWAHLGAVGVEDPGQAAPVVLADVGLQEGHDRVVAALHFRGELRGSVGLRFGRRFDGVDDHVLGEWRERMSTRAQKQRGQSIEDPKKKRLEKKTRLKKGLNRS